MQGKISVSGPKSLFLTLLSHGVITQNFVQTLLGASKTLYMNV